MGRRSRNRGEGSEPVAAATAPRDDGRPEAPWGRFPLMELSVLLALLIGTLGLIVGGKQRMPLIFIALALGSIGGLELSIREHFAGYRSHSSLLAGTVAALTLVAGYLLGLSYLVTLALGAVIFVLFFWLAHRSYERRA